MKKLLLVLLLFEANLVFGQGDYRTLKQCNNDTLDYVLYNFQENKSRYTGKPMSFLLKEMDISLMTRTFGGKSTGLWTGSVENLDKVEGIWFCYLPFFKMERYDREHKFYLVVNIYFKLPPYLHSYDEFRDMQRQNELWNHDYYQFFKDYEIKDIMVIKCNMD